MPGEQEHDEVLMSLVESVIELPPEERDAHLRAVCSDPTLIEEVRTRVVWEERMGSFLRDPLSILQLSRTRLRRKGTSAGGSASFVKLGAAAWGSSMRRSIWSWTLAWL